jgi:hypothetical protein
LGRWDPVVGVDGADPPIAAGAVDLTVGLVAWSELEDEHAAATSVRANAITLSTCVDRDRDVRMARSWRADVSNS